MRQPTRITCGKSNRYIRIVQPTKSRAGTGVASNPARAALALILFASPAFAQLTAEQKQANLASFETVWTTIRDKHWETNPGGLDWQAIHAEYRPRVEAAASTEAARAIMREMIGRLKQTHFAIFPAAVYQVLDADGSGRRLAGLRRARARRPRDRHRGASSANFRPVWRQPWRGCKQYQAWMGSTASEWRGSSPAGGQITDRSCDP